MSAIWAFLFSAIAKKSQSISDICVRYHSISWSEQLPPLLNKGQDFSMSAFYLTSCSGLASPRSNILSLNSVTLSSKTQLASFSLRDIPYSSAKLLPSGKVDFILRCFSQNPLNSSVILSTSKFHSSSKLLYFSNYVLTCLSYFLLCEVISDFRYWKISTSRRPFRGHCFRKFSSNSSTDLS